MQEVVKRLQERQKPEPKEPEYFWLCIAVANDKMYPVILPPSVYGVSVGDIVFFRPDNIAIEGEIRFAKPYCHDDDDIWTALMVFSGTEPVKVVRHCRSEVVKW
jgi:hypothetical protein